jgi:hypothetical protein
LRLPADLGALGAVGVVGSASGVLGPAIMEATSIG